MVPAFDPNQHHRRSVRLPHFDYGAAGAYFVTICASRKRTVFGDIQECEMRLNPYGLIVANEWERTPTIRPEIAIDEFGVMPNHFHTIVWIDPVGACGGTPKTSHTHVNHETQHGQNARPLGVPPHAPTFRAPSKTLGALVNGFKGSVTRQINQYRAERNLPSVAVWQRSFHDRVTRDEKELLAIRQYIIENPQYWERDEHHP